MSRVHAPRGLAELLALRADLPGAALMAGGTDLVPRSRARGGLPEDVILLQDVPELHGITSGKGLLRIGAAATHAALLADPRVGRGLPVLARALACLASPAIRNMGSIGGNICTASPAGDTLPPLHVLEARVELAGREGVRELSLAEFILGPGRTALGPGEVLCAVLVPRPEGFSLQHFEKVGLRGAMAIAVVSLAAMLRLDGRGRVAEARLAWGSAGPAVVRCPAAEAALLGRRPTLSALRAAARHARAAVRPIDDLRASAAYRREVAGNLLLRLADLSSR